MKNPPCNYVQFILFYKYFSCDRNEVLPTIQNMCIKILSLSNNSFDTLRRIEKIIPMRPGMGEHDLKYKEELN